METAQVVNDMINYSVVNENFDVFVTLFVVVSVVEHIIRTGNMWLLNYNFIWHKFLPIPKQLQTDNKWELQTLILCTSVSAFRG